MQEELIHQLKELYPRSLSAGTVRRVLKTIDLKSKNHKFVYLSKRKRPDGVRENQYRNIITELINRGYLTVDHTEYFRITENGKQRTVPRKAYNLEKCLREIFKSVEDAKVYVSNLTSRIREFDGLYDPFIYLSDIGKKKGTTRLLIDNRYIIDKGRWTIYDKDNDMGYSLFDFLRRYYDKSIIDMSKSLKLVG